MDIVEKVRALVAEQLGMDLDLVSADSRLVDDLNADAIDLVELVTVLEEAFHVKIPDHAAEAMSRVQDAIDAVMQIRR